MRARHLVAQPKRPRRCRAETRTARSRGSWAAAAPSPAARPAGRESGPRLRDRALISSRASRTAVARRSASPSSRRPPGNAICPDHGSFGCSARRMKSNSIPAAPSRSTSATAARCNGSALARPAQALPAKAASIAWPSRVLLTSLDSYRRPAKQPRGPGSATGTPCSAPACPCRSSRSTSLAGSRRARRSRRPGAGSPRAGISVRPA